MEGSPLPARTDSPSRLLQHGQANAMLRLSRTFSLEHDIYPKIPKQQLTVPLRGAAQQQQQQLLEGIPPAQAQEINFSRCNMGIIGQERDGVILLARHGYLDGVRFYVIY